MELDERRAPRSPAGAATAHRRRRGEGFRPPPPRVGGWGGGGGRVRRGRVPAASPAKMHGTAAPGTASAGAKDRRRSERARPAGDGTARAGEGQGAARNEPREPVTEHRFTQDGQGQEAQGRRTAARGRGRTRSIERPESTGPHDHHAAR